MHTFTEKVGIVNDLIAYMQNSDNTAALAANHFDVAPHAARLQGKLDTINTLAPKQKALEVAHIKKTAELNHATEDAYTDASGTLDAMMGLLGKSSTEAKKLQAIRSKIRRQTASPTPAPTSTAKS